MIGEEEMGEREGEGGRERRIGRQTAKERDGNCDGRGGNGVEREREREAETEE